MSSMFENVKRGVLCINSVTKITKETKTSKEWVEKVVDGKKRSIREDVTRVKTHKHIVKCNEKTKQVSEHVWFCDSCKFYTTVVKCDKCGRNILRSTTGSLLVFSNCDFCGYNNKMPGIEINNEIKLTYYVDKAK